MPRKRPPTAVPEPEPAALSVSDTAAKCGLSRSRFHALIAARVFPPPVREPGRRPYYPIDLIRRCLDIRRTGVGANGQVAMFNRRPARKPLGGA